MSLRKVIIKSDAYYVALQHALSTEADEVMGLLFGNVESQTHVLNVLVARSYGRSTKQRDRVEISAEQLHAAAVYADQLSCQLARDIRVLGWYHSHPHITVWPSHVDLRTQASLQALDVNFAGIIFSVFSTQSGERVSSGNAASAHRIRTLCFQSTSNQSGDLCHRLIPLQICPKRELSSPCARALIELPQLLTEEDRSACQQADGVSSCSLTRKFNSAVLQRNLCHIAGVLTLPLLAVVERRLRESELTVQQLTAQRDRFLKEQLPCVVESCGEKHCLDNRSDVSSAPSPPVSPCFRRNKKRRNISRAVGSCESVCTGSSGVTSVANYESSPVSAGGSCLASLDGQRSIVKESCVEPSSVQFPCTSSSAHRASVKHNPVVRLTRMSRRKIKLVGASSTRENHVNSMRPPD